MKMIKPEERVIGVVCITAIVIAGMAMGQDGVLIGTGLSLIGGLLGYGVGKKSIDDKESD